jgi:hypothetical protein
MNISREFMEGVLMRLIMYSHMMKQASEEVSAKSGNIHDTVEKENRDYTDEELADIFDADSDYKTLSDLRRGFDDLAYEVQQFIEDVYEDNANNERDEIGGIDDERR